MDSGILLTTMGARIRALRAERSWTLKELAGRAGLSPRFLVQVESGRGNISVRNLCAIADVLGTDVARLLREREEPTPAVALLGLRGAGKTTVGRRLASALAVRFVELDELVEKAADLSLAELFALHGEPYYRRLERECLERLLEERQPLVLATGGGIVTSEETFSLLRRLAVTIWLRARPEDHWNRVLLQGDKRPTADHPQAMKELRRLLRERAHLYAKASYNVNTSGRAIDSIVEKAVAAVRPGARTRNPKSR